MGFGFELFICQSISVCIVVADAYFLPFFPLHLHPRFLHDKNSREFLYYRKKVAEIRKENQSSQASSSQKGN